MKPIHWHDHFFRKWHDVKKWAQSHTSNKDLDRAIEEIVLADKVTF